MLLAICKFVIYSTVFQFKQEQTYLHGSRVMHNISLIWDAMRAQDHDSVQ